MRNMLIGPLFLMGLLAFAQLPGNMSLVPTGNDTTANIDPADGGPILFSTLTGIQPGPQVVASQNFTDDGFDFSCQAADDFTVTGNGWTIDTIEVRGNYFNGAGPAESVNIYIVGSTGTLPDTTNLSAGSIYAAEGLSYSDVGIGDFRVDLPGGVTLLPGEYWLVVQANMAFGVGGQWGWTESTGALDSGNESAWFQTAAFIPSSGGPFTCVGAWNARVTTCDMDGGTGTDMAFRLEGEQLVAGINVDPVVLSTSEAGTSSSFDVVLTAPPVGGATVTIDIGAPDASEGSLDTASVAFTAANWNIPQTVTVTGVDDAIADGDVTYTLVNGPAVSGDGAYSGMAVASVDVTNQDNESAGFTVSPLSITVSEDGVVTATVDINLNVALGGGETVDLPVSSSNVAVATLDTAMLTFTDLDGTNPQTITVTGVDNDIDDGDASFTLVTGDPASGTNAVYDALTAANVADVTGTRTDDDTAGITVDPSSGLVTTEAGGTDTFDVVLESEPTANVTINLNVTDATEGSLSTASLLFTAANWDTPQTVTITGLDDDIDDGNVAYSVSTQPATSTDPNYSGMDAANVSVTNNDDADTTGINIAPLAGLVTTEAGGTDTFTVVLNSEPTFDVTLPFTSDDTTEGLVANDGVTFGASTSLTFTSANWDTPQTITVQGQDDLVEADGDVVFNIVSGDPVSGDTNYNNLTAGDIDDVEVTNTDDEGPAAIIVDPIAGLVTDEDGASDTFTVVLATQPLADVTITLGSDTPSEGIPDTNSLTFTSGNWNIAQTVTVTGQPDFIIDGDIAYTIVLNPSTSADPNYDGIDPDDVAATNFNTDVCGPVDLDCALGTTIVAAGTPTCVIDLYVTNGSNNTADWTLVAAAIDLGATGVVDTGVTAQPDTEYVAVVSGSFVILSAIKRTVPTLGEWGLIAFISLLAMSGMVMMRRRRLS